MIYVHEPVTFSLKPMQRLSVSFPEQQLEFTLKTKAARFAINNVLPGPSGGTLDYEELIHKPRINNVVLVGNKSFGDIGLDALSNIEINRLLT